jgi:hypothetical protein
MRIVELEYEVGNTPAGSTGLLVLDRGDEIFAPIAGETAARGRAFLLGRSR